VVVGVIIFLSLTSQGARVVVQPVFGRDDIAIVQVFLPDGCEFRALAPVLSPALYHAGYSHLLGLLPS
jgi:hypothetical protein